MVPPRERLLAAEAHGGERARVIQHGPALKEVAHQPPSHVREGIPQEAAQHHERLDGKGYPWKLASSQLGQLSRVLAVADVFEALTAGDRPYKKGKTLGETLKILASMKLTGHIDPDLFDVFVGEKVYLKYAQQFLDPWQIDEVSLPA